LKPWDKPITRLSRVLSGVPVVGSSQGSSNDNATSTLAPYTPILDSPEQQQPLIFAVDVPTDPTVAQREFEVSCRMLYRATVSIHSSDIHGVLLNLELMALGIRWFGQVGILHGVYALH
jgi:hypothetical protein